MKSSQKIRTDWLLNDESYCSQRIQIEDQKTLRNILKSSVNDEWEFPIFPPKIQCLMNY